MTHQTIPADPARKIVAAMRAAMRRDEHTYSDAEFLSDMSDYIRDLEALLPAPPTLADMTREDRAACQWMQADVKGEDGSAVIYAPNWKDGSATVLWPSGFIEQDDWENITPRPDLPRMELPGTEKPAPALPGGWRLADHPFYGRVVVTKTTPSNDGHTYFVCPSRDRLGFDWSFCDHSELTYLGQEADQ